MSDFRPLCERHLTNATLVPTLSLVDKTWESAGEAVADIASGSSLAVGGFGLCGIPAVLVEALLEQGADGFEVFSNNVTDKTYIATQIQNSSSADGGMIFGAPRTYGVRLKASF